VLLRPVDYQPQAGKAQARQHPKVWGRPICYRRDLSSLRSVIALICHREKRSDVATSVKVRSVIGLAASLRSSQ